MAALTKERPGRVEKITRSKVKLGANVKAFKGAAAVLDTDPASPTRGFYLPATAAPGLVARGRFRETIDNTGGTNGARYIEVDFLRPIDVLWWDNDTAAPVVEADRGSSCFFTDDHTVSSDNTGRSAAGRVFDLEGSFVIVEVA
jgi:hypothetical protein